MEQLKLAKTSGYTIYNVQSIRIRSRSLDAFKKLLIISKVRAQNESLKKVIDFGLITLSKIVVASPSLRPLTFER